MKAFPRLTLTLALAPVVVLPLVAAQSANAAPQELPGCAVMMPNFLLFFFL